MNFPLTGHRRYRKGQKFFLAVIGAFTLFLVSSVVLRSSSRSALSFSGVPASGMGAIGELRGHVDSGIELEDFQRTQIRDGKKVWNVRAQNARYFAVDDIAYVNAPELIYYRENGQEVKLRSATGKLYLKGDALQKAELEGAVEVFFDTSLAVRSESCAFDSQAQVITSSVGVEILGPGYDIHAVGMRLLVDSRIVDLLSQVRSQFKPGAKLPADSVLSEKQ